MSEIPVEELRLALEYDPETGIIRWRHRADKPNNWNARFAGKAAGTTGDDYVQIGWSGRLLHAHRVAWALHYGQWPSLDLDHINRNPSDNRIANLREATPSQNMRNRPARGVCYCRQTGKWMAHITVAGKFRNLGRFSKEEDALAARQVAYQEVAGEFAYSTA